MRKNAPRKWLHAILDLLPVILIPVFMIYSHRHIIDSGTIEVPQNQVVDFNQKVKNGNFETDTYWFSIVDGATSIYFNNSLEVTLIDDSFSYWQYGVYQNLDDYIVGHKYQLRVNIVSSDFNDYRVEFGGGNTIYLTNGINNKQFIYTDDLNKQILFYPIGIYNINSKYTLTYVDLFDLTQMFGVGNEPTITDFNNYFSNNYYEYNLSHKELLEIGTILYDDNDIMSQSLYQLYNSVDKYFNMNDIFNMGSVYDWFVINVFSGNAPIIMYVVWNIALYELVMDLMFLLYALFMWFVDWCKSLIERTYDVGRGK